MQYELTATKINHKPVVNQKFFVFLGLSLLALTLFVGFNTAVALLICIGVHEMGHLLWARKMDCNTHGFYFLPMIGGAALCDFSNDDWKNFLIIWGGPATGALFSFVLVGLSYILPLQFGFIDLGLIFAINIFVNLINLLPIGAMDGGKIFGYFLKAYGKTMGRIGAVFVLIMAFVFTAFILKNNFVIGIFLGLLSYLEFKTNWKHINLFHEMPKENFEHLDNAERNLREAKKNVQVNLFAVDENFKREEISKPISKLDSLIVVLGVLGLVFSFVVSLYLFNGSAL